MKLKIKEIISCLEGFAPLSLQENYDNAGLTIGDPDNELESILLSIDITEEVINEALKLNAGMIVSHHPLIFTGLKKITGSGFVERCVIKAIRNNLALYAGHTNVDSVQNGVNRIICDKLGLINTRIIALREDELRKLVFFVPNDHAKIVREAIFEAGAGHIGNYDKCSFNVEGEGTFRGSEDTNPFVGEKGQLTFEKELRVETIYPAWREKAILSALINAHPYEEVAYDIYPLKNQFSGAGMGMIGQLSKPVPEKDFLDIIKKTFLTGLIRHTNLLNREVSLVAVCGGSGSQLINSAISQGADFFITADVKYHQFFNAEDKIVIADIGHFESEQFTTEIFYELLKKNFHTFAIHLSKVNTNPVNYY